MTNRKSYKIILPILAFVISINLNAQSNLFAGFENLFSTPKNYTAYYTTTDLKIDGNLDKPEWNKAKWTDLFVDIEGDKRPKPPKGYETRVKMLWNENFLYVAAELHDPHVWATLTNRDEIVFFDNDFEIFLNPSNTGHEYFEIEVNALNNIFDLFMSKPYREGGGALFSWDSQGMRHAVKINGTLNNPNDIDKGWTVEFAIPFRAFTIGNEVNVPNNNDIWRINFSRVQWDTHVENGKYIKDTDENGKTKPENNWVWSPQGIIDMHAPERWGYLKFSTVEVGMETPQFTLPFTEKMRNYLWLIYYKQKAYRAKEGSYAGLLSVIQMPSKVQIDGKECTIRLFATPFQFSAEISCEDTSIFINDLGLVTQKTTK